MNKLINVNRILSSGLLVLSSSLLVACGGGGGGSGQTEVIETVETEPSPEPTTPVETVPEPSPEPTPIATSLEDVQVAESFIFSNQQDIELQVSYPMLGDERAYLNICTQWKDMEQQSIEYSSCVWRGQISQSQMALDITLPAHASTLVAEVWQLSSGNVTRVHQELSLAELGVTSPSFSF
ncbi:hypothetical protein F9L16_10220 [Agarivorans sp. B2Z047]|uniref:hypothetical protein n=1 Tax=Agarivorans sp. B2Z047 TaxID=2652721 RepID=UPI00128E7BEF|nr:hypothetical protein [Agarivorans sp. B2Z047]MPW29371.1 hypothetical protein [Agarivorans sp. B2Z047]UQN44959.1 procyclic acidic repetitive family protein [Agarivorans sp. B2Z047]